MTIADFVQQVFYAIYKVRLDVDASKTGAFHSTTDKFKEVVMEGNMVLQELQTTQDWNFLRDRWYFPAVANPVNDGLIQEIVLPPEEIYKVATGFGDAVRLHCPNNLEDFLEAPYTSPRTGSARNVQMFSPYGELNTADSRLLAFVVGNVLTFNRRFTPYEEGRVLSVDVIAYLPPLHICDSSCTQPCPQTYSDLVFTEIPDPYWMIVRTAAKRSEGDPSAGDRTMSLGDEAMKMLSAMRENDSSKTMPDTYPTIELGYTRIL